ARACPDADALVGDRALPATVPPSPDPPPPPPPRPRAPRRALDAATDAVCTAIEQASATSERRATTAVEQARAIIAQLGLTIRDSHNLVQAARALIERVQYNTARSADLRRRGLASPRPRR